MQWLCQTVQYLLVHWGYWAVLAGILGENAGLPLPGETVLMLAGFLSNKGTGLHLLWLIVIGIAAAVAGDNIGFFLGRRLGPRLIRRLKKMSLVDDVDVDVTRDQIRRHGAATVFWARYIFGLRMLAGPLAGMLGMEWGRFLLFNTLGAAAWVGTVACLGYAFGGHFNSLLAYSEKASWLTVAVLVAAGYLLWRYKKKRYQECHGTHDHAQ